MLLLPVLHMALFIFAVKPYYNFVTKRMQKHNVF